MEAIWVKSGHLGWVLKDEHGGVLACLRRLSPEGTLMRCEISGRSWMFRRAGFSRPPVFQRTPTGTRTARFADDRGPSIPQLTWRTPGGDRVMEIRPHLITARGLVWFRASRPDIQQLRLAALGWYMVLMGAADAGVATAAAIPAATSAVAAASGG